LKRWQWSDTQTGAQNGGRNVPRNAKYWPEPGDCDQLELLQVESIDHRVKNEMIRYDEQKERGTVEVYKPEGVLIAVNVKLGV
jgi:hypothetical protein